MCATHYTVGISTEKASCTVCGKQKVTTFLELNMTEGKVEAQACIDCAQKRELDLLTKNEAECLEKYSGVFEKMFRAYTSALLLSEDDRYLHRGLALDWLEIVNHYTNVNGVSIQLKTTALTITVPKNSNPKSVKENYTIVALTPSEASILRHYIIMRITYMHYNITKSLVENTKIVMYSPKTLKRLKNEGVEGVYFRFSEVVNGSTVLYFYEPSQGKLLYKVNI